MSNIVRNIRRPAGELVRALSEFDPATVVEAAGGGGMLDPHIRPAWDGAAVCGVAFTVDCAFGDNLALHQALTLAEQGDVLVVATGRCTDRGAWGEIMTMAAQLRGIGGLITDGAVRDVDAIRRAKFPVFCAGRAIRGCAKQEIGRINHPVSLGGVHIHAGDVMVAGTDGAVAVRREELEAVLASARSRREREEEIMTGLRGGATTVELLGLEALLRPDQVD